MAHPLLLGLSLARYNRAGACWLGLPAPFNFGSGAGLWWSALAPLLIIHGTIWWTTDMVEHHGAV
eukprot:1442207-Pyramimonas_sp.AAC.1